MDLTLTTALTPPAVLLSLIGTAVLLYAALGIPRIWESRATEIERRQYELLEGRPAPVIVSGERLREEARTMKWVVFGTMSLSVGLSSQFSLFMARTMDQLTGVDWAVGLGGTLLGLGFSYFAVRWFGPSYDQHAEDLIRVAEKLQRLEERREGEQGPDA